MKQENVLGHMNDGVEHGFCICNDRGKLIAGRETSGDHYNVSVDMNCPAGKPIGIFHTHPGGVPEPSSTDIKSARQHGVEHLCIGVPEKGVIKCHRVSRKA